MMEKLNATTEGYFVLLGFSNWPRVEVVLSLWLSQCFT